MDRPMPSNATMFRRAALRTCPRCGGSKSFIKHWLGRYERCRTCGIRWHREHGFELGPIAVNVVFTFFTLAVTMIVAFVTTGPDYNVPALMTLMIGAAILLPLFFYPFTYTLWLAFDLASHKPDQRELAEADAAVAASASASATAS
ncbi:MAG: zinc finger-like domain-containing protein [Actinobacteria bacterium]|nr:zinc finger-like domain-containing protein [Actinomycetota bacterium]